MYRFGRENGVSSQVGLSLSVEAQTATEIPNSLSWFQYDLVMDEPAGYPRKRRREEVDDQQANKCTSELR